MSILKQGLRIKQKALAFILKSLIINVFAFVRSELLAAGFKTPRLFKKNYVFF